MEKPQSGQQKGHDKTKGKAEARKIADVKREFLEEVKKAKELLINGKTEEALDQAFKALMEHKEELGGEGSILLLPAFFILAEGNILMDKLKKAEEFLIAAYWNFLKKDKSEEGEDGEERKEDQQIDAQDIDSYKGKLHKTFSKLYLAQKDYGKALDELKQSIYMDSEKYGANHIITALNYYEMGNIFLEKRAIAEGEAFYGKTAEIFYKYFKYFFRQQEEYDNGNTESPPEEMDTMVIQEAYEQQTNILGYFVERYPEDEDKRAIQKPLLDSQRALALMFRYYDNRDKYQYYIQQSVYDCMNWKGDEHPKTLRLKALADGFVQEEEGQGDNYDNSIVLQQQQQQLQQQQAADSYL